MPTAPGETLDTSPGKRIAHCRWGTLGIRMRFFDAVISPTVLSCMATLATRGVRFTLSLDAILDNHVV